MSEAAKVKCDACEAESDWVCRKCYHHIVLVCGTMSSNATRHAPRSSSCLR
jgi:hypothetical protein